jgi:transcriptional regulator with XRE-family HTH domain
MEKTNIAQNIRNQRILKGLSQEKLAELAQISLRTVQRIENNETEPRGHSLLQIATVLNTTPEHLHASITHLGAVSINQNDRIYLTFLSLSALSFFIFPMLGILIPFVLWMIKIGQIKNIARIAKRLILFEVICCVALYLIILAKIMHWPLPDNMFVFVAVVYVFNLMFILTTALINWRTQNFFRFRKITE